MNNKLNEEMMLNELMNNDWNNLLNEEIATVDQISKTNSDCLVEF